jgi:5-methylthioadenosine/S-adenosylhomocysteine deaminase
MMTQASPRALLVRGVRVFDHDGDTDDPPIRNVLLQGSRIVSVTAPGADAEAKAGAADVIEGHGKLIMPGFVNAHYHSHDVLTC